MNKNKIKIKSKEGVELLDFLKCLFQNCFQLYMANVCYCVFR